MSKIEIFTLKECPNCHRLMMMLDRAGIVYEEMNIEASDDAMAEAAFRGILNCQYPVVYIGGMKLDAMTPIEYFQEIKKA